MTKLRNFSGVKKPDSISEPIETKAISTQTESPPSLATIPSLTKSKTSQVNINIKIDKEQKDWLSERATQIRANNHQPVSPGNRVYPQHLIQVAISLLQTTDVDWTTITSINDLQKHLKL